MPRVPADQPHHDSILRAKLHRPPVAADAVRRIQLHELMDLGLETPLTLVSAPAGYGKSTLVSHWIESLDHPTAWLSLGVDGQRSDRLCELLDRRNTNTFPGCM